MTHRIKKIIPAIFMLFLALFSFGQNADVAKSDGIGAESQEMYEKAAKAFEEAINAYAGQNVTDTFCIYHAGLNYSRVKQYEKAVPFLEKAIALDYSVVNGTKMLADAYTKLKKTDKAENILLAAREKYTANSFDFDKKLGYLYFNTGKYEKAANAFKTVNEQSPGKKSYMYMYAFALERTRKYKQAIDVFRELNQKFPTYKNGTKMLGITLFEYAEQQNKKIVASYNSKKGQSLDDYLVVKKKLDKIDQVYKEAQTKLNEAQKDFPNDKQITDILASIKKTLAKKH